MSTALAYPAIKTSVLKLSCQYVLLVPELNDRERETTRIKKRMFLEILDKSRGIVTVACQHVDIARSTYYEWLKNDFNFKKATEETLRSKPDILDDLLYKKALAGNVGALKYMLSHLHPNYKREPRHAAFYQKNKLSLEDLINDEDLMQKYLEKQKIDEEWKDLLEQKGKKPSK